MKELSEETLRAYVPDTDFFDARSADAAGISEADLPHFLYGMARLALLKNGLFSVHAACVGNDHGKVLIVGHSGDGKTTVALKLIREFGYRLRAGNKTVVRFEGGTLLAIAGTTTVTEVTPQGRRLFRLDDGQYETRDDLPIRAIVKVKLNDGADSTARLAPLSALHTLYPFFLDAVNADVVVSDGGRVLSGNPPDGVRERLAKDLLEVLGTVPAHAITGSLHYLIDTLRKL